MSKFIPGHEYICHNDNRFKMKIKSRGTKYISGAIYYKTKSKNWSPISKKWESTIKEHRIPFEKIPFNHLDDQDDVWFFIEDIDKRIGFVSD